MMSLRFPQVSFVGIYASFPYKPRRGVFRASHSFCFWCVWTFWAYSVAQVESSRLQGDLDHRQQLPLADHCCRLFRDNLGHLAREDSASHTRFQRRYIELTSASFWSTDLRRLRLDTNERELKSTSEDAEVPQVRGDVNLEIFISSKLSALVTYKENKFSLHLQASELKHS